MSDTTVAVWITDGSLPVFSDTHHLTTKTPKQLHLFSSNFEGLIDRQVMIGSGSIPWQQGGHDAELEWALCFDDPLAEIEITEHTPCTLQGMIEGKNLQFLLGEKQIPWSPASIGNNVIASADTSPHDLSGGIRTTIGDILNQEIQATMRLSFRMENGSMLPERVVDISVLQDFPLLKFLHELQTKADAFHLTGCRIINLGANGKDSGYVNNMQNIFLSVLGEILLPLKGFDNLSHRIRHRLVNELIMARKGMARGSDAALKVYDNKGNIVGQASLITA